MRVWTHWIIETVDVTEQSILQLWQWAIKTSIGFLMLEISEKAFHHSIIVRIPFRRKRLDHIMLIQKLPKTFRCKLTAPIRMKHHAGRYTPCPNGILQRCNRKVCVDSSRQAKCYDFAGEQIHDRTKIIESTSGSDICKIAYPSHIRFFRFELLLQQIFAGFAFSIGMRFLFRRLKCAHFRKIHRFHQTVHSAAADVNAIFSCKAFGYFLRTQSLVAFDVKCKNFCTKLSVFNGSARIFAVAELVVGAPIDLQNPTKCCNSVFMTQRMDCV